MRAREVSEQPGAGRVFHGDVTPPSRTSFENATGASRLQTQPVSRGHSLFRAASCRQASTNFVSASANSSRFREARATSRRSLPGGTRS